MKNIKLDFKTAIKNYNNSNKEKINLEILAKKVGVHYNTMLGWNKNTPDTIVTLIKILKVLEIDLNDLISKHK